MKAISIKNPYAQLIVTGLKPLEVRSKPTHYRGELLICTSQSKVMWFDINPIPSDFKYNGELYSDLGCAIGTVTIANCRPMTPADETAAWCKYKEGLFVYELTHPKPIKPFPVKGKLGFFNVDLKTDKL